MSFISLGKQYCRNYATLGKIFRKSKFYKIHGLNSQRDRVLEAPKCNALQQ